MNYFSNVLFLALILVSISCQKIDEKEIELSRFNKTNAILLEELDKRQQLIKFSFDNNICSIVFSDGFVFSFSGNTYPLLTIGEGKCWSISGNRTTVPVRYDIEGYIEPPVLSIIDSSVWAIDGTKTSFSAENYLSLADTSYLQKRLLQGLVSDNEKIMIILSDNTSYCLSQIDDDFYLVPSYYLDHLVEKERIAENFIAASNDDFTSFIFFTDTHWDINYKHSPALIRHITDYTGISNVFFGGDVIYKHASSPADALKEGLDFQKSFSFLGHKFYCLYGNHDNNSDGQAKNVDNHLTESQVESYLQSQMTVLDKKEGYNFYFDEFKSKTRFIGLDTGRYYYSQFRSTALNTASFLIESLQSVPEGWHIIVLSHIFLDLKTIDGRKEGGFSSFYSFPLQIMDNYNQHLSGKYTYNKETILYDFTESKGHVEFCLGGHIHIPSLLYTESGIPVLAVPTDSKHTFNNDDAKKGTITEQSVSIFAVDYSEQILKLVSIGRGIDREISLR